MARAATTSDSFNAVAEPRRREILNYLALQERAVGEIAVGLKMEQPSVSKHLRVLRKVGLGAGATKREKYILSDECGSDPALARVDEDFCSTAAAPMTT
jgi:DNA-binding transcriptional ArsR family regulator